MPKKMKLNSNNFTLFAKNFALTHKSSILTTISESENHRFLNQRMKGDERPFKSHIFSLTFNLSLFSLLPFLYFFTFSPHVSLQLQSHF